MIKRLFSLAVYFGSLLFMFWIIGFIIFCLYALSFKYYPQKETEAIVVLTGGTNRVKTGLELMGKNKAEYMLISGVHKEVSKQELFPNTPPETLDKITLGYDALDTKGNAQELNFWLKDKHIHSILLVTSFYHMPRSIFEIRKINKELKIVPWPVFPKSFDQSVEWIKTRYAWLLFIEYHKFVFVQLKHIMKRI